MTSTATVAKDGKLSALVAVVGIITVAILADIYWGYRGLAQQVLSYALGCFVGVGALGQVVVPLLRAIKAGQFIREDGPQAHLQKAGTPTMGGIYVIPVGLVTAMVATGFEPRVLAVSMVALGFGLVGWLDDWQILRKKSNQGISPQLKLILQGAIGLAYCIWLFFRENWQDLTTIQLPLNLTLSLGLLFFPLALFVILGSTNATNLTDGLDGLAAGTGAIALWGLAVLLFPQSPPLAVFCGCMAGSYLGFLWHNRYPAQVFMGDTGSLALGGALAGVALAGDVLWGLLVLGLLFVWEAITVILQVAYYKATKNEQGIGKRLFKMAPYHHHLELSGWHETKIVLVFYGIAFLLVAVAVSLSKL